MEYRTEFGFNKAIKVDEAMLKDIVLEIEKYCEYIEYSSELENGDTIKFESVEELIAFENSKIYSFKALYISARDKEFNNRITVSIEAINMFIQRFSETVLVEMKVDSIEKKTNIKNKIEEICIRHEQDSKYNIISKTGIFNILSAMYFSIAVIITFNFVKNDLKSIDDNLLNVWFVVTIVYLIKGYLQKLQKRYYPPIVFYTGDGMAIYDKKEKGRDNFFWGGIVAVVLGAVFFALEIFLN